MKTLKSRDTKDVGGCDGRIQFKMQKKKEAIGNLGTQSEYCSNTGK